jgi:TetR/AcrR family transcriptional regulator, transcriptional repressor for nem operon
VNYKHHETFNQLVQKAIELFSEKGYCSTNLIDISDALGISRGPIYYYFKDKIGLYDAAFDKFDNDVRETHRRIIECNKPFNEFVEDVIFDCVERNTLHGPNFFFGIESYKELEDIKVKFDKMNEDIFQEKIDYVNQSKIKGEIHPDADSRKIADLIYIVFFGLLTSIQKGSIRDTSESNIRALIRILTSGIMHYSKDPNI